MGLAFRWDFRRSGLFFQTRPGSYNDVSLIGFLNEPSVILAVGVSP